MRVQHEDGTSLFTVALLVVLIGLVGITGAIDLAQSAADSGPQVGDILTFDAGRHVMRGTAPGLAVRRAGGTDCEIDPAIMARSGGSLVIEWRTAGPHRTFGVHWAGRHSSAGAGDCGASAQLVLTPDQLQTLAIAAGGFGADPGAASSLVAPPVR